MCNSLITWLSNEVSNDENFGRKVRLIINFLNNSIRRHREFIGFRDFRIFENISTLDVGQVYIYSVQRNDFGLIWGQK